MRRQKKQPVPRRPRDIRTVFTKELETEIQADVEMTVAIYKILQKEGTIPNFSDPLKAKIRSINLREWLGTILFIPYYEASVLKKESPDLLSPQLQYLVNHMIHKIPDKAAANVERGRLWAKWRNQVSMSRASFDRTLRKALEPGQLHIIVSISLLREERLILGYQSSKDVWVWTDTIDTIGADGKPERVPIKVDRGK